MQKRMRVIVICDLFGTALFFRIISNGMIKKKQKVAERKMYVLILSTSFV
jgi:hypothetical protein